MADFSNFQAGALSDIASINNTYTNSRYAPIGDQKVGEPFPLFRQPAAYFTDWTPAGQSNSLINLQLNLPTDTNKARIAQQNMGVDLGNEQNNAFVFRTQTLANNGNPIACRNNTDCSFWPGTTCNAQYMSWNDAKGNQGNFCSITKYPELESGTYQRKLTSEGGIGKACNNDNACGEGYYCNNRTDIFGKNIQQTGYCAQKYDCGDGKDYYLGYPYNSGIPIVPSPMQNNGGRGYPTENACKENKLAQQDCVQDDSGRYFATYPGYCPVQPTLRKGGNPQGALGSTPKMDIIRGITIPAYATNEASTSGGTIVNAFSGFELNSNSNLSINNTEGPLMYELSINPE